MAQRLSRVVCAAGFFLLAGLPGVAQSPIPLPPAGDPGPKPTEPPAAAKKLPAPEASGLKLPPINYTRSRSFKLPVVMDKADRLLLNEIRLYTKTPSTEWKLQEKGDRDLTNFSCELDADGEYWYALALVDKQGKMAPAEIKTPDQRVMVDTVPPVVGVQAVIVDGIALLRCTVEDANSDPATLKAVSRTPGEDVPLEAVGFETGLFRVKNEQMKFPIVATAKDLAGHVGTKEINPGELLGAKANAPPSDGTKEPAAKNASPQEVDAIIEKAFGKGSRELKRPIRLSIGSLNLVVAAEKAAIEERGKSVRFTSASIAFLSTSPATFGGEQITFHVNSVVKELGQLANNPNGVARIEIEDKDVTITLMPMLIAPPLPNAVPFPPAAPKVGPTPSQTAMPPGAVVFLEDGPNPADNGGGWTIRFKFKIDPKAAPKELLPTPPKSSIKLPHWTNEDLTKVAELSFGEPISKDLPRHKAMQAQAHAMAKINHVNAKKTDGFMVAMLDQRSELRGLPFLMGDDCRTHEIDAKVFAHLANKLRGGDLIGALQEASLAGRAGPEVTEEQWYRGLVAVAMQIGMAETKERRVALAKNMAAIATVDATKALAKLAIFSPEDAVRATAIEGLKTRRERDYTDILTSGFRYPLPAVSKRAAEALVKLERKDLLVNLIEVLESPDPRLPVAEKGKTVVRELVKVNHHRNCLLCHAPGNTDNTPDGVLKVAVPLPGEPLPKPSEGGYQSTPPPSPDIVVRLDMTYLRQDFSMMMPVSDPHPWPEMQRFDFLVRTRELTSADAKAYESGSEEPGRLSPYHRAALYALRELTGRDTAPTAAAWRKLLKL